MAGRSFFLTGHKKIATHFYVSDLLFQSHKLLGYSIINHFSPDSAKSKTDH